MGFLERLCLSAFVTELAKYRSVCMILASVGILTNLIRVVFIGTLLYTQHLKNSLDHKILVITVISIVVGLLSCVLELFLVVTMRKKYGKGLKVWMYMSIVILLAAISTSIASFVLLDNHSIGMSFLFDVVRIGVEFFVVNKALPVFSMNIDAEDGTVVSFYSPLGEAS